jgi:WD40 repeat protein
VSPAGSSLGVVNRSGISISGANVEMWGETHLGSPVWCIAAWKSGILCGCDNGSIVLLNSNLDCCFRLEAAHGTSPVVRISWASDGLHFLSVGTDLKVRVWCLVEDGSRRADCVFTLPQISPVIAAEFHPLTYPRTAMTSTYDSIPQKSNPPVSNACTVLVLTADRKITVWTDGMVEQYESMSSKDASPVCMSIRLVDLVPYIAIGTKTGELLLYSFQSSTEGMVFNQSLVCRNRQGKFKDGTPIVSIFWISDTSLIVASQDDRLRLVSLKGGNEMSVIAKFKGHESSRGEVALPAFVVSPPFGPKIVQCGSECGKVFIWSMSDKDLRPVRSKLGGSNAVSPKDSWAAVGPRDKLTALSPAPWTPDKGRIGASCTVSGSLDGAIRLFICKYDT